MDGSFSLLFGGYQLDGVTFAREQTQERVGTVTEGVGAI
jgi:hypothetical protein